MKSLLNMEESLRDPEQLRRRQTLTPSEVSKMRAEIMSCRHQGQQSKKTMEALKIPPLISALLRREELIAIMDSQIEGDTLSRMRSAMEKPWQSDIEEFRRISRKIGLTNSIIYALEKEEMRQIIEWKARLP